MNENANMDNLNARLEPNNFNEQPPKAKSSKGLLIVIILLLIALIGGGVYYIYQKHNNSNNTINSVQLYKDSLNSAYTTIEDMFKNSFSLDIFNDSFSLDGSITLNTDIPDAEILNGFKLDLMGGLDYKNKIVSVKAGLSKNTTNLSALITFINNKGYLECKDIFTKPIYLGEQDIFTSIDEVLNKIELPTEKEVFNLEIIQKLKDIVINTLDENKFTTVNETINLEGKDYNVTTITYHMDEENQKRTKSLIKEALKNDTELSEIFSSLDIDENETGENFDIVTYIYKNKLIGANIYLVDAEEQVINLTNIDDLLKIKMENEEVTLNLEEKSNSYSFSLKDEEAEFTMDINKNGSGNLSFKSPEVEVSFNLKNITNTSNEISLDFDLKMKNKEGEVYNINIDNAHLNLKKGTFTSVNTSDAVDADSLTETELSNAAEKIRNILSGFGIDIDSLLENY